MPILTLGLRKLLGFIVAVIAIVVLFWMLYTCPALVFLILPAYWAATKLFPRRLA